MVPTWSLHGPSMVLISIHLLDSLENLRFLASLQLAKISCARMVELSWVAHILKLLIAQLQLSKSFVYQFNIMNLKLIIGNLMLCPKITIYKKFVPFKI